MRPRRPLDRFTDDQSSSSSVSSTYSELLQKKTGRSVNEEWLRKYISKSERSVGEYNKKSAPSRNNQLKSTLKKIHHLNLQNEQYESNSYRSLLTNESKNSRSSRQRRKRPTTIDRKVALEKSQSERITAWEKEQAKVECRIFKDGSIQMVDGWIEPSNHLTRASSQRSLNYEFILSSVPFLPRTDSSTSSKNVLSMEGMKGIASDSMKSLENFVQRKISVEDTSMDDGAFSIWGSSTSSPAQSQN